MLVFIIIIIWKSHVSKTVLFDYVLDTNVLKEVLDKYVDYEIMGWGWGFFRGVVSKAQDIRSSSSRVILKGPENFRRHAIQNQNIVTKQWTDFQSKRLKTKLPGSTHLWPQHILTNIYVKFLFLIFQYRNPVVNIYTSLKVHVYCSRVGNCFLPSLCQNI